MNWEYSLGAIAVILIISYGTLVVLRKRGKADQANKRTLFISTVIAIGFALLTPILAKMLSGSFNASVLTTILIALMISILLGVGVGVLTMIGRKKASDAPQMAPDQGKAQVQGIEEVQIQLEDLQKSDEDLTIGFAEGLQEVGAALAEAAATEDQKELRQGTPESNAAVPEASYDLKPDTSEAEAAASEALKQLDDTVWEANPSEESHTENEWDAALFAGEQRDSALEKIVDTERITDRIGIEEDSAAHNDVAWPEAQIIAKLAEAEEHKAGGRLSESIACLYEVLTQKPDKKLSTLIIIEICSLSKKMDNAQYVRELLESDAVSPLDATIKEEILSNI